MSDKPTVKLFVVDTGPLITLAASESLDCLAYIKCKVYIADAVFLEATRERRKIGAQAIIDWAQRNADFIQILPTQEMQRDRDLREIDPTYKRNKDLGERASLELLNETDVIGENDKGVLVLEDHKVVKRLRLDDYNHLVPISTMDLLSILEEKMLIQSADAIIERAIENGRTPAKRGYFDDHDEDVRDAVRDIVENAKPPAPDEP